jgi:hypothetical protein
MVNDKGVEKIGLELFTKIVVRVPPVARERLEAYMAEKKLLTMFP